MSALWNRTIVLIFGPIFESTPISQQNILFASPYELALNDTINTGLIPMWTPSIGDLSKTLSVPPKNNVQISNLRITFSIDKTVENKANKSEIKVYNISKNTWKILNDNKSDRVYLYVGYQDKINLIFTGDITNSSYERQGENWIGTIESGDGQLSNDNSHVDIALNADKNIKEVFRLTLDNIKKFGIDVTTALRKVDSLQSLKTITGSVFSGMSKDIVEKLSEQFGLRSTINNSELLLMDQDSPIDQVSIYLNPMTGLLDSPKSKKEGIEFKSLIIPGIDIGKLVTIDSENIKGTYIVEKIRYSGDNYGNKFYCECDGKEYGSPQNQQNFIYQKPSQEELYKPLSYIY